jgi:hypothetical protein
MSPRWLFSVCVALAISGCTQAAEVEWMKVGQPYTAAEFRRDYTQCEKTDKLDECLRGRGWVSVTAPTAPKVTTPDIRTPPGGGLGGGRKY